MALRDDNQRLSWLPATHWFGIAYLWCHAWLLTVAFLAPSLGLAVPIVGPLLGGLVILGSWGARAVWCKGLSYRVLVLGVLCGTFAAYVLVRELDFMRALLLTCTAMGLALSIARRSLVGLAVLVVLIGSVFVAPVLPLVLAPCAAVGVLGFPLCSRFMHLGGRPRLSVVCLVALASAGLAIGGLGLSALYRFCAAPGREIQEDYFLNLMITMPFLMLATLAVDGIQLVAASVSERCGNSRTRAG